MFDADKTRMIGLPYGEKVWPYVKPFSSDTGMLRTDGRTDGQTDGQTDLLYQYRASVCWRAIKTVESAELPCRSQQCNSTNSAAILRMEIQRRYLLLVKNNKLARGSQGFVGQSSRNVALRVEQPSVLNKFFLELQYSAAFGRESRKLAGGLWKYAKFRHFLAHPVV